MDRNDSIRNHAERLAEAHWEYIEALLRQHDESELVIDKIGFHYRTAFVHGYKHGMEATGTQEGRKP